MANETKCGDCLHFPMCSNYVDAEETFPEVEGGCTVFKNKDAFVEVVRCANCIWFDPYKADKYSKGQCLHAHGLCHNLSPKDYCSLGERKDNERKAD